MKMRKPESAGVYSVYMHTFPNGKRYVGITSLLPEHRWNNGRGYLHTDRHGHYLQPLVARAVIKYGWDNVRHEILATGLTKADACALEVQLIAEHRSTDPACGYNISSGGQSGAAGRGVSDETRAKLSRAHKGKRMADATKRKLSVARAGKSLSDEHRQKLSDAHEKKEVVCLETGETYSSVSEAAQAFGVCKSNIIKACKGIRKTAAGYRWRYGEGT